jgi:hypothetical protein
MNQTEDRWLAINMAVLALSGVVLVGAQVKTLSLDRSLLEKQRTTLADRVTESKNAQKQVDDALEQRERQLKRAAATEAQYAGLLSELLELSKVDPDARLVIQKWKIQTSAEAKEHSAEGGANQTSAPAETRPAKAKAVK